MLDASESGVDFHTPLYIEHPQNYLYHSGFAAGSICIGDLNGDDYPDLFFTNGPDANALYLHTKSDGIHFQKIEHIKDLDGDGAWSAGSAFVDIDNDGDLDIYICNYDRPNQLFINETTSSSQPHFVECAAAFGLDQKDASLMPAFADYDLDGDLDLYILNNQYYRPKGRPTKPPFHIVKGKPKVLPSYSKYYHLQQSSQGKFGMESYGRADRFYRNNGKNDAGQITFTERSHEAGIIHIGHGLSVTWWDYNDDRYPDLYIGNDFTEPDRLYHNNRDGSFKEVIKNILPYCSWSSMGAASADFNRDTLPDLFSADMAATTHFAQKVNMGDMSKHRWLMENGEPRQIMRNMFYINTGARRFMETAWMSNLAQSDWTWAVKAADFDDDAYVDLFLSNGMVRNFSDADIPFHTEMLIGQTLWDIYKNTPPMPQKNLAFRNLGNLHFEHANSWGLDQNTMSYGAAYGDLDLDGDLDLVVINLDASVAIYRNELSSHNRVLFKLKGTISNRHGIGTKMHIETASGIQSHYFNPTGSFLSSNSPEIHFGLGTETSIQKAKVFWPSGIVQTYKNLRAGFRYIITESYDKTYDESHDESYVELYDESHDESYDSTAHSFIKDASASRVFFDEVALQIGLDFRHRERIFDDFKRQPLLPGKLSQLGPGIAWGDANHDGREELFVGGAAGQSGALYSQNEEGIFKKIAGPWQNDSDHEDMGLLWFDADCDGDLDLFVGSGGVEGEPKDAVFGDRLYLNLGKLHFKKAPSLPHGNHSTSTIVGGDFDGDGDIDLFIGSRSIPGHFPISPQSHLLRNDSQKGHLHFVDVTKELAPDLSKIGLVSAALWSDANADGALDLFIATEWGPIFFFENQQTQFINKTSLLGLNRRTGWWNSIDGRDVDGDGDVDYLALNVGLNTKYGKATFTKPMLLFYGDMDGSGRAHCIEAKPNQSHLFPIRGRSCSASAMPILRKRFPSFRAFASADLDGIYTPLRLQSAQRFEATCFESGILKNESKNGTTAFRWEALPRLAQSLIGYGVATKDADGDGNADIFIVGNNDTREAETGLWRGAPGIFMRGKKGEFEVQLAGFNGLLAPNDTKGLTVFDLDHNGTPDYLAAENNGRLLAFRNPHPSNRFLKVRLDGPRGNPSGIGSRILLNFSNGDQIAAEIYGGSGYLSQSSSAIFFGRGGRQAQSLQIHWTDGHIQTIDPLATSPLTITY